MFHQGNSDLQAAKSELKSAEDELEELNRQLRSFEAQVDQRIGKLLDELCYLNTQTVALNKELRHIRDERLFGADLMRYLEGAPLPARPLNLNDLPPVELPKRRSSPSQAASPPIHTESPIPDIKTLYRRLARRYHPDLARSDADRTHSNEQMKEINQAYQAGDLRTLMRIAGLSLPYGMAAPQATSPPTSTPTPPLSEYEQTMQKLKSVRQQLAHLSSMPIVKLSLDVKLARHQGRDLLGEMAGELKYKIARKVAERDYLQSQIDASLRQVGSEPSSGL